MNFDAKEVFKHATFRSVRPSSLEGFLVESLYSCGLFENEVKTIMNEVKASPATEMFKDRWSDDISGYPPMIKNALWLSSCAEAVKWIDANKPKHWARPMFTGEADALVAAGNKPSQP